MRIVATALLAGLAAGLVLSVVQQAWVGPLIFEAETFETAAGDSAWAPGDGLERTLYSALANILIGVGYALLLGGAIALSRRAIDWRRGLLWGLAGFVAFGVAPALGLPPDPPGIDAGELAPRQLWWLGTVAATALGLWLLTQTKQRILWLLGALALVAPHVVGAPVVDLHDATVPPGLIDEFIAASLVATGMFWLVLGGMSGFLAPRSPSPSA